MFIAGRFIVGFGLAFGQTAAPTLVAELCPVNKRGFALGLYYACWGVGTLIASGVCYGVSILPSNGLSLLTPPPQTQSIPNNWSWRIPSLLQAAPSFVVFGILFFLPESPRWLISRDRHHEALQVLQITQGDHKNENPESSQVVAVQYREIADTIAWEKEQGLSLFQAMTRKSSRRRLGIAATFSLFVMLPGTNLITFYFGDLLASAGITDPTTQLEVNVILTSWTLVVAVLGSLCADKFPRKWLCAGSLIGGVITLYMFAGLTAVYGQSNNTSGIYATVAMIFLYNATYGFGITPLTVLYPPEILSFDIRAVGMGLYTFTTKLSGLFVTMVLPFGLAAISWKVYIINASVDILFVVYVVIFWVETRGLTLEEVDRIFDGEKHSDVADLQEVKQGVVEVDPLAVIEGKDVGISTEVRETGEKDV